ncbi:MAG: NGG1p interacting factor NIF3 [Thiolinea sp.]
MPSQYVKIAVFVPAENADDVREALGRAGAGKKAGSNYSYCTFSTKGTGRFLPEQGANPHLGKVGSLEAVAEERIETICARAILPEVLAAMKAVHPYEEVAYDVWAVEDV